jgi:hypothetical protein
VTSHPLSPSHVAPLLTVLRAPARATALAEDQWDHVLRMGRAARLHGVLAHRLAHVATRLPVRVREQLGAARNEAHFARAMVLHELQQVRRTLAAIGVDLLVLKGGAYAVQDLDCAHGRMPADLDIMVRRPHFERVEQTLVDADWRRTELDDYDTRYYRNWVHQAPPLRAPGHPIELDLHHAILPPRGRLRIDTEALWRDSIQIGDHLRVLAPTDQVVHAAVHLFVDSDCMNRLRDLVDIAQLVGQFQRTDAEFVARLEDRARGLGAERALAHAAAFASAWFNVGGWPPPRASWTARAARALMALRLSPPDPDATPPCIDVAYAVLSARSLALRLPLHLALLHAVSRPVRRPFFS